MRKAKILSELKLELYLIWRLLREGFGPSYWWPYAKNRFFGNYLFRYLPVCQYDADPELELHTICSKKHIWMFAWMLRSFLATSGLKPTVFIHDDRTMDQKTAGLICSKFPGVKIMFYADTTKRIMESPDIPEIVKAARKNSHFFFDRMINIFAFSRAKKIIVTDCDILFYKAPTEVMDFVSGEAGVDALSQHMPEHATEVFDVMMDEYYTQKYHLQEKRAWAMNGGYVMFDKQKLNMGQLVEFLEHVKRPVSDYFIDMSAWASFLTQMNFKFLPPDTYMIKGRPHAGTKMKHYTSPRRYEMFAYGFDLSREAIRKLGKWA